MRHELAVIIPAHNEATTVGATIDDFSAVMPHALLVVVNNNSQDSTAAVASRHLRAHAASTLLLTESRQGKAFAVRRGFHEVDAEVYLLVDADMTYPAQDGLQLVQAIVDGNADMAVGNRIAGNRYNLENKRRFHTMGNRIVRSLVNWLFKGAMTKTCGCRV